MRIVLLFSFKILLTMFFFPIKVALPQREWDREHFQNSLRDFDASIQFYRNMTQDRPNRHRGVRPLYT